MKKRGISPLVATILLIGFVIILAALIMTWGLDIYENMKEQQKKGEIDLICLNEIKPNFLKSCSNDPKIEVIVDNPAEREIISSLFRVKGSIGTDLIKKEEDIGKFETTTFDLSFDVTKVGIPQKIEFIPYIIVDGKEWACDVKKVEKELIDCPCTNGQTKQCGIGISICTLENINCVNEKWTECNAKWPESEICDEVDNDCDNSIDEDCSCSEPSTRVCGVDKGICKAGIQICTNGLWEECGGTYVGREETEICYDTPPLDNDCDGLIDEFCECEIATPPVVRGCYTGPAETRYTPPCKEGSQTCNFGIWGVCEDELIPQEETLDEKDNDCDGIKDNSCDYLGRDFQIYNSKISNIKVDYYNKNIHFDYDNSGSLIPIDKFLIKVITPNREVFSETYKGAEGGENVKYIAAYFDLDSITDNIQRIEIYPYINGQLCDVFRTTSEPGEVRYYYDPSLVAFYPFDEGKGYEVYDVSIYEKSGILKNVESRCDDPDACPIWVKGKIGGALEFDGISGWVKPSPIKNLKEFSICLWIKPEKLTSNHIIGGGESNNQFTYFSISGGEKYMVYSYTSSTTQTACAGKTSATNNWEHICYVTTGEIGANRRIYLNGVDDTNPINCPDITETMTNPGKILGIGRISNNYYTGIIDEVAVWNRVLIPEEIEANYKIAEYRAEK